MGATPTFAHVVFQTGQLEKMKQWYLDLLDGHVVYEGYVELKDKGIEPAMPIQHGLTTSLYYEDPDGNFVELQVDNFPAPDQAAAYMYGPEFDADAIGPSFSPEAFLAGLRAGVPAAEPAPRAWALAHPFEADRDWPQGGQADPR